jgi:hypothetical protein
MSAHFGETDRDGLPDARSGVATVARRGLPGKMAGDDLVCPPPVSARDHSARRLFQERFTFSYRDVEDLLAKRGLDVFCETVRP